MKYLVSLILFFVFSTNNAFAQTEPKVDSQQNCTLEIKLNSVIGAGSLDYLERAMSAARHKNCNSILMLINTPGGNLQTTRDMVQLILNSDIPVLCLVYPSGAHAGSAGAIILQACHVAGAVEATNIGAATPISATGGQLSKDLRKKILNDTISWLDGITKMRGRDLKFSHDIITQAKAVDAKEALKLGAIDTVSSDIDDYLKFANGRTVRLSAKKEVQVKVGELVPYEPDARTQILSLIADPEIAYLMFLGSLGLIYFEVTHPGMMAPGVVGGIGFVLSMISMNKLNVSWGAVALVLLGLVFMIAEAFVPSFGALGIGGTVAFVLGSLFLFDPATSGYSLPLTLILPTSIFLGLVLMGLAYLAFQTRHVKRRATYDVLVGKIAKVVQLDDNSLRAGLIEVNGETWKFLSKVDIALNDEVKVTSYKGLTLNVEK